MNLHFIHLIEASPRKAWQGLMEQDNVGCRPIVCVQKSWKENDKLNWIARNEQRTQLSQYEQVIFPFLQALHLRNRHLGWRRKTTNHRVCLFLPSLDNLKNYDTNLMLTFLWVAPWRSIWLASKHQKAQWFQVAKEKGTVICTPYCANMPYHPSSQPSSLLIGSGCIRIDQHMGSSSSVRIR